MHVRAKGRVRARHFVQIQPAVHVQSFERQHDAVGRHGSCSRRQGDLPDVASHWRVSSTIHHRFQQKTRQRAIPTGASGHWLLAQKPADCGSDKHAWVFRSSSPSSQLHCTAPHHVQVCVVSDQLDQLQRGAKPLEGRQRRRCQRVCDQLSRI